MKLADTEAIAHLVGRKPATIRDWHRRGILTRYGTTKRALWDIEEAEHAAQQRPLDKPPSHLPR